MNNILIVLPQTLQSRSDEFSAYLDKAIERVQKFAYENGWERHTAKSFMDKVMIFDSKPDFDKMLLELCEMPSDTELPETYCGALEERVLAVVTPEIYSTVYPQGVEEDFYTKILAHEIAHRLHVRILEGDEDAMGPVWFFEGFALYAADQFCHSKISLTKEEIIEILSTEERGSYEKYAYVFRYLVKLSSLKELVSKAGSPDFTEYIINIVNNGGNMSEFDFPALIKGLPEADITFKGITGWLSQGPDHQIVFMDIAPIGEVPDHSHGEQWGVVLEGEMDLKIDGVTKTYRKGDSYYIGDGIVHGAAFRKRTFVMDMFRQVDRYKAKL